jgi:hypothetical protein
MACRPGRAQRTGVSVDLFPEVILSPGEARVWGYLQERARGRVNAVTQPWIAGELGMGVREVQEVLHSLVADHGLPICTTSGKPPGAFIAEDAEDLRVGESNLRGRIVAIARRYRALHGSAAARELLGQLAMELEGQE